MARAKKNFREIVEPVQRKEKWPLIFFLFLPHGQSRASCSHCRCMLGAPPPPIHQIIWHLCHKKSCVSVFRLLIVWTVWDYTQRAYDYCKFNYLRCLILYIACMLHAITHVKKTRGGKKKINHRDIEFFFVGHLPIPSCGVTRPSIIRVCFFFFASQLIFLAEKLKIGTNN
jgi:hypothetical protein